MKRRQVLKSLSAACALMGVAGLSACRAVRSEGDAEITGLVSALPSPWRELALDPERQFRLRWTEFDPARQRLGDGLIAHAEGLQTHTWFAPGSWVKLPIALLALEQLEARGLGLDAVIALAEAPRSGEWSSDEPLQEPILRTLRRVFVVSDNTAANRLFEFLGQDQIHQRLTALGYPNARIVSRMGSPDPVLNRQSVAVEIRDSQGGLRWQQALRISNVERRFPHGPALAGRGWFDGQRVIAGAHDFSTSNYLDIADMHQMLLALVCPEAVPAAQRWQISESTRLQVLTEMARWPEESPDPRYAADAFPHDFAKFLLPKSGSHAHLRLFGKSGQAYGYLNDAEAILDTRTGRLTVVSASIYANADGIFNDDVYEYDSVATPTLAALAERACARIGA